jgi:periplasmic protein TonB
MSPEPRKVSEVSPKASLGSLSGCLVDGDAEQRTRQSRVKRRALAISILLQSAVLTLLMLVPLFAKTERIAAKEWIPIPPYGHPSGHPRNPTKPPIPRPPIDHGLRPSFPSPIARPPRELNEDTDPIGPRDFGPTGDPSKDGANCSGCVDIGGKTSGPPPPQPVNVTPSKPAVVRMTTLDPAMLRRRVEPVYPTLAKQIHKEGRVELRAIIGTDGTIRSLQIISGDPLFFISAREAVEQWLYKPTVLNGQPVEIDTYITVIYNMQH